LFLYGEMEIGERASTRAIFCFTTLQLDLHCFSASRAD
jgi:hypothetical protein